MYFDFTYEDTLLKNLSPGDSLLLDEDKSIWILVNKIPQEHCVLLRKIGSNSESYRFSYIQKCKKIIKLIQIE